jgi:uncharacterized protein (TIGR04255 family)
MTISNPLPDYENPPVIEVVCGIFFESIDALLAPHLGLLWDKFRAEYPECQEVAPLFPQIEKMNGPSVFKPELTDRPPLPRVWFVHSNGTGIIQVQRDAFLHNWKKVRPEDDYPRYGKVMEMFRDRLSTFESFLDSSKLGTITPIQYEMTYVNHILHGEGWERLEDIGEVFPDFCWRSNSQRFLPPPEAMDWRTNFLLPDRAGRLRVRVRHGKRKSDDKQVVILESTVRGIQEDRSRQAMWRWFDLAREWIVRGFADLTGQSVQTRVWRRKA